MKVLFQLNKYNQQRQKDQATWIYPIQLAMYATALRNQGDKVTWDKIDNGTYDKIITSESQIDIPFLQQPIADRILTDAKNPKWQGNGNFKYLFGTYIMASNSCWWKKCNFCIEKLNPVCETRSVMSVIQEIIDCSVLGFREIFDDSGTFPVGDWLKEFCQAMIRTGLNKQVTLGCNMRFGALDLEDFDLMKQAGFRMILWGLESVNQSTLDRLNKGIRVEQAYVDLSLAKKAGLWSHVAVMFGYPWENCEDEERTFEFIKQGLLTNKIKTAQASIYDVDWDNSFAPYENVCPDYAFDFRKKVYALYHNPRYLWHRIKEIRNFDDIEYYLRGVKKLWTRK